MDCRTKEQVQQETIYSVVKLQHEVKALFPWKISYKDDEVILSNDTIQLITQYIKQLQGKG